MDCHLDWDGFPGEASVGIAPVPERDDPKFGECPYELENPVRLIFGDYGRPHLRIKFINYGKTPLVNVHPKAFCRIQSDLRYWHELHCTRNAVAPLIPPKLENPKSGHFIWTFDLGQIIEKRYRDHIPSRFSSCLAKILADPEAGSFTIPYIHEDGANIRETEISRESISFLFHFTMTDLAAGGDRPCSLWFERDSNDVQISEKNLKTDPEQIPNKWGPILDTTHDTLEHEESQAEGETGRSLEERLAQLLDWSLQQVHDNPFSATTQLMERTYADPEEKRQAYILRYAIKNAYQCALQERQREDPVAQPSVLRPVAILAKVDGAAIATYRRIYRLNQSEFGSKIRVAQATVSAYESGRHVPERVAELILDRYPDLLKLIGEKPLEIEEKSSA